MTTLIEVAIRRVGWVFRALHWVKSWKAAFFRYQMAWRGLGYRADLRWCMERMADERNGFVLDVHRE